MNELVSWLCASEVDKLYSPSRKSRGVTQHFGKAFEEIVSDFDPTIDVAQAYRFLDDYLAD